MAVREEDFKKFDRKKALERAKRRASYKCPVIVASNHVLNEMESDSGGIQDIDLAFDLVIIELEGLPEGAATAELINRFKGYSECQNKKH